MKNSVKDRIKQLMSIIPYNIWKVNNEKYISDNDWLTTLLKAYKKILVFFPRYPFKYFFGEYKQAILAIGNSNQLDLIKIREKLINYFVNGDTDEKMFAFCILTECHLLDNETVRRVLTDVIASDDRGYKYWMTMEISYATFYVGGGFYNDYYNHRREAMVSIADSLNLKVPPRRVVDEKRKKLCIVTYQLNPDMHNSAQRVCSMMANNLQSYFDEVCVVCLDSTYKTKTECREYLTISRTPGSFEHKKSISEKFNQKINVIYSTGKSFSERLNNSLLILYNFTPDIIIDITDEYSPLSLHYSKDFFTVYVPMRGAASSLFYSAILGVPFKYEQTNMRFNNCIDMSKVIEWSFPEYIPPEQGSMTKHDVGISDGQFCIISIGNNSCFSNSFVDEICRILKNNDRIVWLLVGNNAPEYLHQKYAELLKDKRVIEWGYEDNLAGICRACDVHLRYDMTGGSGGTAIAAMQGLPVVMTNFICDASRWLGLDYSSIDNYHDLAEEIQRLYSDREYYEARKQVTLELVGKAVDSKEKWEDLYNTLIAAYERWKTEGHV